MEAIIGAVATIFAALLVWWLQRRDTKNAPASVKAEEQTTPEEYARKYLDDPSHYRFLRALPKLRKVVMENAAEGWNTGVTLDMREANYDVIDFLQYVWLRLSQFYPPKHWGSQPAEDYIRSYIRDRFTYHWAKHEPDGPGTGGTIVGVVTGGDVVDDLERLIADTVSSLFRHNDDFDLDEWQRLWREKPAGSG